MLYFRFPNNFYARFLILCIALVICLQFYLRVFSLNSHVADFGFFLANSYASFYQPPRLAFTHFQPILYLFSFVSNGLETSSYIYFCIALNFLILVYSALWIQGRYGDISAIIFICYTPVWILFGYDYHLESLLVLAFIIFYRSVEENKKILLLVSTGLMALVKEPYIMLSAMGILYFLFVNFRATSKFGRFILISSAFFYLLLFVFVLFYIIPHFSSGTYSGLSGEGFSYIMNAFYGLESSSPDLRLVLFEKFKSTLVLLVPLLFLPLLYPGMLLPILPSILLFLLSASVSQSSYFTHYNAALIVTLLVATFKSHYYLECRSVRYCCLLSTIFVNLAMGPVPFGRLFLGDKVYEHHYSRFVGNADLEKNSLALENLVPKDPTVSLSVQNNVNYVFLARRFDYWLFPSGVTAPHTAFHYPRADTGGAAGYARTRFADYVVVDLHRPPFIYDKGCSWVRGSCTNPLIAEEYEKSIDILRENYENIYSNDGFQIFKRR